jgi:hypothetical protein
MADDTLTIPEGLDKNRVISIPILQHRPEKVGRAMTANIVAVGAINAALNLFSEEVIREAVRRHIPRGTEELNNKALAEGGPWWPIWTCPSSTGSPEWTAKHERTDTLPGTWQGGRPRRTPPCLSKTA